MEKEDSKLPFNINISRISTEKQTFLVQVEAEDNKYSPQWETKKKTKTQCFQGNALQRLASSRSYAKRYQQSHSQSPINKLKVQQERKVYRKSKIDIMVCPQLIRRQISPYKPKQCQSEHFYKNWNYEFASQGIYTDQEFPPHSSIIYPTKNNKSSIITFKRLPEIYKYKKWTLLQYCEPTHLIPSSTTNTSVYCSLSILCRYPQLVCKIFESQQINQKGMYYALLNKDGVWRYVVVDDFMPYEGGREMFVELAGERGVQGWVCLVEKALAKIYGSYSDLEKYNYGIKHIFKNLIGAPCRQYDLDEEEDYKSIISKALLNRHIVILDNCQNYEQSFQQNFSYQVISLQKNMLQLFTPHSRPLTTSLNLHTSRHIFTTLLIFPYTASYKYTTIKLRHKKGYFTRLKLTTPNNKKVKGYFQIHQNNKAYYKSHIGSRIVYEYGKSFIVIKLSSQEEMKQVQSGDSMEIDGQAVVDVHVCQQKEMDFGVSFYGEELLEMERLKGGEKWQMACQCE